MSGGGAGCCHSEGPAGGETDCSVREQPAEAAAGQLACPESDGAEEGWGRQVRGNTHAHYEHRHRLLKLNCIHSSWKKRSLNKWTSSLPPSQNHPDPTEGCLHQTVWRLQWTQRGKEEERGQFMEHNEELCLSLTTDDQIKFLLLSIQPNVAIKV